MINEILLDYIGKTKTQNLVNEINKEYFERVNKIFPKIQETCISNIRGNSLVTIEKEKEILSIGMSCPHDLLTDNFGLFWNAILSRIPTITLVDTAGSNRSVFVIRVNDSFADTNGDTPQTHALGSYIVIGSGFSTPTRSDFTLTSIIGGNNATGFGGWNSGLGQMSVSALSAVLVGSGNIAETGLLNRWFIDNNAGKQFMMSHDLISPVVPFVNGQVASIEYTLQL